MDDMAVMMAMGVARPPAGDAMKAFADAFPDVGPAAGARRRAFDERTTVGLMLGQVFARNAPCKDAVRSAQVELGLDVSASTAAFCKARGRVRESTLDAMSARLSSEADGPCGLAGFVGVQALDGTTFQASDTDENRAQWPYAGGQRPGCGFPVVGALVAHSLVGGGSTILAMAPWKAHDFRLFVAASSLFKEGELEIGDRAFCSYAAFALLRERGAEGIFRGKEWCRRRRDGDVALGKGDRLTKWHKRQMRRSTTISPERMETFPEEVTVRVITAKIRARGFRDEEIVIVTSLLNPKKYPKEMVLAWYLRRWEIEVSFRDMKTTLRYEFVRGHSPRIVKLELHVLLLAYNLMRYVMSLGRIPGSRHGIASTAAAFRSFLAVVRSGPASRRLYAAALAKLVAIVAADTLRKRKRKPQVRAVKRRPKPYPLLMKPRWEYRPEELV